MPSADINGLLRLLEMTSTGSMLSRVFNLRPAPIVVVPGSHTSFVYDEAAGIIIAARPSEREAPLVHAALALAFALRNLDQALVGFTHLDPMASPRDYAAKAHSKALDAIVHVCRIALELQQSEHGAEAMRFLESAGIVKIFEAVRRDASDEEVYDAYASSS